MTAVKIKLVKGPTLQRLVVLVLLSLAGLGYPPDFCEAIKCYCTPGDTCPKGGSDQIDCPAPYKGCQVASGDKGTIKGCDTDGYYGFGEKVFKCVQERAGGSGNCVRGTEKQLQQSLCGCLPGGGGSRPGLCGGPRPGGHHRRRRDLEGFMGPYTWNDTISGRAPGGDEVQICTCRSDLCNSDTATLGKSGRLVTTGSKEVQQGIFGLIIIRLASNELFF